MKTGAVISAADYKSVSGIFQSMLPVGDSTVIRRMIITLKQAGVDPIVVVTGNQGEELEKHISKLRVICLKNENYENKQMFSSICMGLDYIERLCDRVIVLPAKFPVFLSDTVKRMMENSAPVVCPVYDGRRGHPIMLSGEILPLILSYRGEKGLRGAIRHLEEMGSEVKELPVEDEGIIMAVETDEDCALTEMAEQRIEIHPQIQLSLERDEAFFGATMAQFLSLIDHTGSMQTACRQMHMSYTKGWKLLKTAEKELGFPLLVTRSGGSEGGYSQLTQRGEDFLKRYLDMEKELTDAGNRLFRKYFSEENKA